MKYVGIDLGNNGGISVYCNITNKIMLYKNSDFDKWIDDLIKDESEYKILIEDLHAMPASFRGGISQFTSGYNIGHIKGYLNCLVKYTAVGNRTKVLYIQPVTWQKKIGVPSAKSLGHSYAQHYIYKKSFLKNVANSLFPKEKVFLWNCDSLLIMNFCRTMIWK